eukprot:753571-Hanusia_phi.AAC.3
MVGWCLIRLLIGGTGGSKVGVVGIRRGVVMLWFGTDWWVGRVEGYEGSRKCEGRMGAEVWRRGGGRERGAGQ